MSRPPRKETAPFRGPSGHRAEPMAGLISVYRLRPGPAMTQVMVYIDGFNVYHGLKPSTAEPTSGSTSPRSPAAC